MKNKSEFNLEHAVFDYINTLNSTELLTKEDTDEVYDHWITEAKTLTRSGLTPREAFEVVNMRFGNSEQIHREYLKNQPVIHFWNTLVNGIILYSVIRSTILCIQLLFKNFIYGNISMKHHMTMFFGKAFLVVLFLMIVAGVYRKFIYATKFNKPKIFLSALILLPVLEIIDNGIIPRFRFITSWGSFGMDLQTYKEVILTDQAPLFIGINSGYLMVIVSILVFITALFAIRNLSRLRPAQAFSTT